MKRFPIGNLSGALTIAGLAAIVIALANVNPGSSDRFLWLSILALGVVGTLLGGIQWAHSPGKRKLKTALLGLVCCPFGAAIGGFLGDEMSGPGSGGHWEWELYDLFFGMLIGAILFLSLGVWWGIAITRRLGREAGIPRKSDESAAPSK